MAILGHAYIWPDDTGVGADPTAAYTVSTTTFEIQHETEISCIVQVAGAIPTALQLWVEVRFDNTNWFAWCERTMQYNAGVAYIGCKFSVPTNCAMRVSLRRWGGTVNTIATVLAMARTWAGDPNRDDEPVELAAHQINGVVCWSDGAGAADACPAAWAAGPIVDPFWIPVGQADTMIITATLDNGPTTNLQLRVRQSSDLAVTDYLLPAVNNIAGGIVDQSPAIEQLLGADGTYRTRPISVDPGSAVLVEAQRIGAATDLIAWARFYRSVR